MPTQGSALAGSLAATLQAVEIQKLISDDFENSIAGSEVLFDARHGVRCASRLGRNPACRFSHERWSLTETPNLTLAEALALTPGSSDRKRLFVPDCPFVTRLVCAECGLEEEVERLRDSLDAFALACPRCHRERRVRGFDLVDRLSALRLGRGDPGRTLFDLGLRGGEVFGVESADARPAYFAICDADTRVARGRENGAPDRGGRRVVVAGLGNIGSFFAAHMARTEAVRQIVLADPDSYEPGQEMGQDLPADAVGRKKVEVQAERLHAIRPGLEVEAFADPVERLPLGRLWGALTASCLDSRVARVNLAARAWHVGSPFVDAAVGGASLLVRTNVYLPTVNTACFECAFEPGDYARLEQIFPCNAERGRDANPTNP